MKAMSVIPGQPDSATAADVPEPPESDGSIQVDRLLVGICGTDIEITHGPDHQARPAQRLARRADQAAR